MATTILADSQIRISFENGLNEKGEMITTNKTLNNVKTTATTEQILQVVNAMASIVATPVYQITRNDKYELQN